MGNILLIGPSGAGKTTISKKIIEKNNLFLNFIADTSRNIRDGEINGLDYNFTTTEYIISKNKTIEDYLVEEYFGKYYGYNLQKFNLGTNFILCPGIKVAEEVLKQREKFGFIVSILLTIDKKTFFERLKNRGETIEEIKNRESSLELLDFCNKVDLVINGKEKINFLIDDIFKNYYKNYDLQI